MTRIAVVGAGIIGLATAVELQRRGHDVTLIDRDEPASGCSRGNAGIIAVSDVLPLISLTRILSLPGMALRRLAPVSVRPGAIPALIPWLGRAAGTLTTRRQSAISAALAALNGEALSAWRSLLAHCDAAPHLVERGMIELTRASSDREDLFRAADKLRSLGQAVRLLDGPEVIALEPALSDDVAAGLLHERVAHVLEPYQLATALLRRFGGGGGVLERADVRRIEPGGSGMDLITPSLVATYDVVAVCTGHAAARLLGATGSVVPLQIERGYHLHLPGSADRVSRPLVFRRESFVATPMATGLRLAGTIEFSRSADAPDWRRAKQLARHAAPYFRVPLNTDGSEPWFGNRPSLPDSLPAIGASFGGHLLYAFGHQHLGLTQAAVTARIVADLNDRSPTIVDPAVFSLERFAA